MIVLGLRETVQLIDGGTEHAAVRALQGVMDRVAFSAPALAYAADAIAREADADERMRLQNELDAVLRASEEDARPGLGIPPPLFTILPFDRREVREFQRISRALSGRLRVGALQLQTLAVAYQSGATLLLGDDPENRRVIDVLGEAGIHIPATWAS